MRAEKIAEAVFLVVLSAAIAVVLLVLAVITASAIVNLAVWLFGTMFPVAAIVTMVAAMTVCVLFRLYELRRMK